METFVYFSGNNSHLSKNPQGICEGSMLEKELANKIKSWKAITLHKGLVKRQIKLSKKKCFPILFLFYCLRVNSLKNYLTSYLLYNKYLILNLNVNRFSLVFSLK